jgi:SulP family sulfate permease
MTPRVVSQLIQEFRPNRLLLSLTAGLVSGIVTAIIEISFATLIFSGDLSTYVSNGIGLTLFGAFVVGIVGTATSSFSGTVVIPQDSPTVILAVMAAIIANDMPPTAMPEDVFFTVVTAIVVTSLLTGAFFLGLGTFKLGSLIRYVPYPVVGGFLAGTGWLLVQGAVGVMADASLNISQLPYLLQANVLVKWLPGLVFAALLLAILRRYSHFLIIPSMVLVSIGLFYALLWLTHTPVAEASAQGWLLGSFPEGGLWRPLTLSALGRVNWSAILSQAGNMGTVLIISVISLLLNASGIELTVQRDIDLNRELRSAGIANLVAGLGGSPVGYHALSLSALGHRIGSNSRLVGLSSAALCGATLFFGAPLLSFFPKPVLGGLLLFLGLTFLVEWVYDAWFKLSKADYLIVLLILITINAVGVLEGVGLGLLLAVGLFVVSYSRTSVVKHTLSGASCRSNVDRPRVYRQLLRKKGDGLYVLELQGFIFFGTANKLLDQVRQRISDPRLLPPRFILLDFRQVSGLDASAALSFTRMKQLALAQNIVLVFTHLSPRIQRSLERQVFTDEDKAAWRIYPDLDHGLEQCEEQMIQIFESIGITAQPRTVKQQLEKSLPGSGRFIKLFELLAPEEDEEGGDGEQPDISIVGLQEYLERMDVEAGHYLIRQGDAPQGLYFVDVGQVTAQIEYEDGRIVRVRKMGAGAILGEVGLYVDAEATASVVTNQPSAIYYLSAENLKRMEQEAPEVAVAFHRSIARLLSERLSSATDTLQALLE